MLELKKVSKSYRSKLRLCCDALDDINLKLPSMGMIFIQGKSGSGKTTLLNILAGLDSPSTGSLIFNDKEISSDEKSLDKFRNNHIGFVFQDYNLLEDITVEKNIELALRLQNIEKNSMQISNVLDMVGLSNLGKRFPSELSGGQKQRVAIARALVKNSDIIFADEPTGNLDSSTGDEIFSILKSISKTKLVIVVTHDKENALKYADRIIELKDGKIINDSIIDFNNKQERTILQIDNKSNLPNSFAIKMGWSNICKRKIRTISTILIAILSIFSLAASHLMSNFSTEQSLAITAKDNKSNYFILFQDDDSNMISLPSERHINQASYELLNDLNIKYLKGYGYNSDNYYIIKSQQEMISLGFDFHCATEITNDSVYVTDYWIEKAFKSYYSVYDGVDFIQLNHDLHSYEYLVGKIIKDSNHFDPEYIKIAGIVKTNYRTFFDNDLNMYKTFQEPYKSERLFFAESIFYNNYILNSTFCKTEYLNKYNEGSLSVLFSENNNISTTIVSDQNKFYISNIRIMNNDHYTMVDNILTKDSYVNVSSISLKDDEVIISIDLYNKLFNQEINYYSYIDINNQPIKFPSKIGEKITVKLTQNEVNEDFAEYKDMKIIGVRMDIPSYDNRDYLIYMSNNNALTLCKYVDDNIRILSFLDFNADLNAKLFTSLRKDYSIGINYGYSQPIYDNEQSLRHVSLAFMIFSIVSGITTLLVMINLISFSIMSQKKEIGVLRAMGARKKDIYKIYLFQSSIISLITLVFSFILARLFIMVENYTMSQASIPNITFIEMNFSTYIVIFCASIILITLASFIPLRLLSSMRPIDAIRP